MDTLTKSRRPFRAQLTRITDTIKKLLESETIDEKELWVNSEMMERAFSELDDWDSKVKNQLVIDAASEEVENKEYLEIDKFRHLYYNTKASITRKVRPAYNPAGMETLSVASEMKKRKFKLPEVKLQTFSGNLKEWLGWWSQFQKIHHDDEMHATDKFEYLAGAMKEGSEPKQLIDSYPRTEGNYEKAVDALRERFGRPDLLLQVYMRELLTLVIANVSNQEKLPLSQLYLQLESHLRCLTELQLREADPATWLFPLVESSLSEDILRAWQRSAQSKIDGSKLNPPKTRLDMLMEFMKIEVQAEQQIQLAQQGFQQPKEETMKRKRSAPAVKSQQSIPTAAGLYTSQSKSCGFCDGNHPPEKCFKARKMTPDERNKIMKMKGMCFRCLQRGHLKKTCKANVKCGQCAGWHYELVCFGKGKADEQYENRRSTNARPNEKRRRIETANGSEDLRVSLMNSNVNAGSILLNTLKVMLKGKDGKMRIYRLVGDSGSERSYGKSGAIANVKNDWVDDEWLQTIVFGAKKTMPKKYPRHTVTIVGMNGEERDVELLLQEAITGNIREVPYGPWVDECQERGILLNDVGKQSTPADILIGNDYWGALRTGRMVRLTCGLIAEETVFGWTLGGPVPGQMNCMNASTVAMPVSDVDKMWKLEAIGIRDPVTQKSAQAEEVEAVKLFQETTFRDSEGRYVVTLPWRIDKSELPTNVTAAEKRLKMTTLKLKKMGKFEAYNDVFLGWEKEGLITRVSDVDFEENYHLLPHRPVFKDSETTPCRPVYDASNKQGRNPSLNDCLFKGPNLIELIPVMLLRFSERVVGVTADIRKAFQTIAVNKEDQAFQRFLWWEDSSCQKMIMFQHLRVVFGITSSPFLLGATITHHLKGYKGDPVADKLKRSFYVDNLLTSLNTKKEYENFLQRSKEIMEDAKMELRQWASSEPEESCTTIIGCEPKPEMQILGVIWNRKDDTLSCAMPELDCDGILTKRSMLSTVAKVFDPMGWLCPAMLIPKLLVQETWKLNTSWDDIVPEEISRKFKNWVEEMKCLKNLKVPRFAQMIDDTKREVHLFADSSRVGMAAVAFVRTEVNGEIAVQFLIAKSRLTPTVKPTIPRSELVACVLAVRIAKVIAEAWEVNTKTFSFWSDSTTSLAWIKRNGDWGVFVRNRVNEILASTTAEQWLHVPGLHNPADLPSRGCDPRSLLNTKWWEGPDWLRRNKDSFPKSSVYDVNEPEVAKELKKTAQLLNCPTTLKPRFGTYIKNVAVWGWVKRFCDTLRKKTTQKSRCLTDAELREAEKIVIKNIQTESFSEVCDNIGGIQVEKDSTGILRVKTRLTNRKDKENFKYPIVLPKNHPLVDLLIRDMHIFHGHGGVQFLLSKIREKYWILQSRRAVRRVIRKCVMCKRHTVKNLEVEMADLPASRVNDAECFATTGVDLAGPLYLKDGAKAWIVLYTCAVYRAVYLDVVTSLSTEAFVNSLERFVSTYGRVNTIYSDNGTNFVGAAKTFKLVDWTELQRKCNVKQIRWVFNPPTASWWGGFWERLVRSVKDLLKRMLGRSKLTFDELRTCLAGVAATINDRPLTAVSEDNKDLVPLTPAMFLRPRIIGHFPELGTSKQLSESYRKMKEHQSRLQARFRKEYLSMLVHRGNKKIQERVDIGDVVLVGADNRKRYEWPLGLVVEFLPSRDGKKRVAKLRTAAGIVTRPVQRLYPLEVSQKQKEPLARKVKKNCEKMNLNFDSSDMFNVLKRGNDEDAYLATSDLEKFDSSDTLVVTKRGRFKEPVRNLKMNKGSEKSSLKSDSSGTSVVTKRGRPRKISDLKKSDSSDTTVVTKRGRVIKEPVRYGMWNQLIF